MTKENENVKVRTQAEQETGKTQLDQKHAELIDTQDVGQGNLEVFQEENVQFYSTVKTEDFKDKVKVFNAINNTDGSLSDLIGEKIKLKDVIAHPVTIQQDDKDNPVDCVRIVIITESGKSYGAVSDGIVNSLQKIFAIFGRPSYEPGLDVVVRQKKTRLGWTTLTLEVLTG